MMKNLEIADEVSRRLLAVFFEKKFKGTEEERIISLIVDKGKNENKDYYRGAEIVALKALKTLSQLGEPALNEIQIWSMILGYISCQLVTSEKKSDKNKNSEEIYIS